MNVSISPDQMTFVLIPGAGIDPGAWCWTVAELEARGHQALAPWLPLHDPDAGPSDHAEAVIEAVGQLRGPLVVVGQSLGAFAASLVAARIGVSKLVLLAPMVPAPGESAGDWWTAVKHDEAIAPLVERLGPMSAWGPEELAEVFVHDVPADIASRHPSAARQAADRGTRERACEATTRLQIMRDPQQAHVTDFRSIFITAAATGRMHTFVPVTGYRYGTSGCCSPSNTAPALVRARPRP